MFRSADMCLFCREFLFDFGTWENRVSAWNLRSLPFGKRTQNHLHNGQVGTLNRSDAHRGGAEQLPGLKQGPLLDLSVSRVSRPAGVGLDEHKLASPESEVKSVVKRFISSCLFMHPF
ncbi:MAG TPA: hypothetical protein DD706_20680 [Nitrospiraceae bacterium]|nr:hypothetical protein [Nitrospiraceae bacterium]